MKHYYETLIIRAQSNLKIIHSGKQKWIKVPKVNAIKAAFTAPLQPVTQVLYFKMCNFLANRKG